MRRISVWLMGWLLGFAAGALTLEDVSFQLSFDGGARADLARGNPQPVETLGQPELVPGLHGQALKLRSGVDALVFELKDNLVPEQGAICFYLSPVNWDASNGDALQVLMHTNGTDQQLAVQTLWPWGKLFMPLWSKGKLIGGFPAGRTCTAPMKMQDDLENVLKPGRWYQYLITWRDGYEAIYLDGKRMNEARNGGIVLRHLGDKLIIGWDKRSGKIFWDTGCDEKAGPLADEPWESLLDDVTILRSFVFDTDAAKIFQYGAIEYARRAEPSALALETAFYQTRSELEVQLVAPGREARQVTLEIANADGAILHSQRIAILEDQGQVIKDISLNDLPAGVYQVRATMPTGFETPWQSFEKVHPEWLGNDLGAADVVLPPFTPLEATEADGALIVSIWGRTYVFDGPFPNSIESQGEPILQNPVRSLSGDKPMRWSAPALQSQSPTKLVFTSSSTCDSYDVTATTRVEYDGMIWCELAFKGEPATLTALRLEIPFAKPRCIFLQYPTRRDCWFPKEKDWSNEWRPCLFVGDDERGLQWFAESDQWWYGKDSKQAFTIANTAKAKVLQCNMIRDPIEMPAEFDLRFGFIASPMKPRPADWRGYGNSSPYRLGRPEAYKSASLDYSWWSVSPGWLLPNGLRPAGEEYGRGLGDWLPFTSTTFHGVRPYGEKDLYNYLPLWRQFGPEWRKLPESMDLGSPGGWNQTTINPAPSFRDRFAWEVNELFSKYSCQGLYFDGYAGAYSSGNLKAGFGYVDRDGAVKATYPILAGRELMRRIYALRLKHRPDGMLMIHPATNHVLPVLSFASTIYDGEFMGWSDIKTAMQNKGVLAGFSEDKARFLLNFRAYGIVPVIDTRWARRLANYKQGTAAETDNLMRLVYGQFMLADVHAVDLGAYSQVMAYTTDWWGLADTGVQYIGYWEERPAASAGWASRSSAWIKPGQGEILLATLNASAYGRSPERLAREGKFGYELKLDLARLGLTAGHFRAYNAESLGKLDIPVNGDTLSLTMGPYQFLLIGLEATP